MESESIAGVVFIDGVEGDVVEEGCGLHGFVLLAAVEPEEGLGVVVDLHSDLGGGVVPELPEDVVGVDGGEAPFILGVFESIVEADSVLACAHSESEVEG